MQVTSALLPFGGNCPHWNGANGSYFTYDIEKLLESLHSGSSTHLAERAREPLDELPRMHQQDQSGGDARARSDNPFQD